MSFVDYFKTDVVKMTDEQLVRNIEEECRSILNKHDRYGEAYGHNLILLLGELKKRNKLHLLDAGRDTN